MGTPLKLAFSLGPVPEGQELGSASGSVLPEGAVTQGPSCCSHWRFGVSSCDKSCPVLFHPFPILKGPRPKKPFPAQKGLKTVPGSRYCPFVRITGGSESKGLNLPPTSKTAKGGDVCLQGSSLRADRYLNRINLRPFNKWGEDNKPFLKYALENISQLKAGSAALILRGARPWLIPPCLLLTSQSADMHRGCSRIRMGPLCCCWLPARGSQELPPGPAESTSHKAPYPYL